MLQGLIKDLVDVTLSSFNGEDDPNKSTSPSSREDRTRSSWSQVVSGDDREEDGYSDPRHHSSRPHHRKDEEYGRNERLDADRQSHPPRRPQKVVSGDDQEEGEYSDPRHHSSRLHHRKDEDYGRYEVLDADRQSHPPRRPQREENDGRDEGWETIGQRPQQRRDQKVSMDNWNGYKRPPSEQEYSNEVDFGTNMEPSEEELADLSSACNRLWELDVNRLVPGKDYEIDCGEGKKAYQKEDMAQGSLFSWLSDDVFRRPTYSRFCSLLDNYNPNQGSKENVTSQERQEQAAFIEEISRTAPIKYLHKYLVSKGIVPKHYEDFKRVLTDLWFELYGRGGTSGCSSAFEHVFVGEIKQRGEQEVSGFHNWIQFYLEEAKGRVDYQGYIFPRRRGQIPDSETQLLTVQFEWNGVLKSLSSTLIGVSPEFEVALYTLCFFLGEEDNHIQLGPYPVNIKCYRMGRDKIGSVFPIAEC